MAQFDRVTFSGKNTWFDRATFGGESVAFESPRAWNNATTFEWDYPGRGDLPDDVSALVSGHHKSTVSEITVLSSPPAAIRVPSGLNATLCAGPVWPVSG